MQTSDLAENAAHLPVCAYIAFTIWWWIILTLMAIAGGVRRSRNMSLSALLAAAEGTMTYEYPLPWAPGFPRTKSPEILLRYVGGA